MKNWMIGLLFVTTPAFASAENHYKCALKSDSSGLEIKSFRMTAFNSAVGITFIGPDTRPVAAVAGMLESFSMADSSKKKIRLSLAIGQTLETHLIHEKDGSALEIVRALDASGMMSLHFNEVSTGVNEVPPQITVGVNGYTVTCDKLDP